MKDKITVAIHIAAPYADKISNYAGMIGLMTTALVLTDKLLTKNS
jgi:hypothetical protein